MNSMDISFQLEFCVNIYKSKECNHPLINENYNLKAQYLHLNFLQRNYEDHVESSDSEGYVIQWSKALYGEIEQTILLTVFLPKSGLSEFLTCFSIVRVEQIREKIPLFYLNFLKPLCRSNEGTYNWTMSDCCQKFWWNCRNNSTGFTEWSAETKSSRCFFTNI